MSTATRALRDVITAHRQREGAGFIVRRPLPTVGLELLDPFLLIDEMGPLDQTPGDALGAPDHPHRGFETVSYILAGEVEHEDSAGNRGLIGAGDVQWMTAGAGVVHSEMPSRAFQRSGGRMHGFQIWVNLPARLKMTGPRYQEVPRTQIPVARSEDDKAELRLIAGEALGIRAAIDTHTPILFHHWTLEPGAEVRVDVPESFNLGMYVFGGGVRCSDQHLGDGQFGVFERSGSSVAFTATDEGGELLLLGGEPLAEPVARYGPFVMNTAAEIREAFADFKSGRMGSIAR